VLVGMHARLKANLFAAVLRTPGVRREESAARAKARGLLAFCGLERHEGQIARNLSYGDQRRLEVARQEVTEFAVYDYVVINDEVDRAVDMLRAIVEAERARTRRMQPEAEQIVATFGVRARA